MWSENVSSARGEMGTENLSFMINMYACGFVVSMDHFLSGFTVATQRPLFLGGLAWGTCV